MFISKYAIFLQNLNIDFFQISITFISDCNVLMTLFICLCFEKKNLDNLLSLCQKKFIKVLYTHNQINRHFKMFLKFKSAEKIVLLFL